MPAGRLTGRFVLTSLAAIVLAAIVLYVQASRVPENYHPARLTANQKAQAAREFLNGKVLNEFGNAAQSNEAFDWSASQEQINQYLAAMDEIASSAPSVDPGTVYRGLERAGLAEPAVALRDGVLTVMVRSRNHDKVLSADLSFSFTAEGKLYVQLVGTRVGRLALPNWWVRSKLEELKGVLKKAGQAAESDTRRSDGGGLAGLSSQDVAAMLSRVLASVDDEPISTELTWRVNRKRVRIDNVRAIEGLLRLHVVPVNRDRQPD